MITALTSGSVKDSNITIERGAKVTNTIIASSSNGNAPEGIRFQIQPPVKSFFGRSDFLVELHQALQSQMDDEAVNKVTLLGQAEVTSGLGKRETARKYIAQYAPCYHNIIWINAKSEETLQENFQQLAKQKLGINIYVSGIDADGAKAPKRPLSDIIKEVYTKLDEEVTLIVFADAGGQTLRSKVNVNIQEKPSTSKSASTIKSHNPMFGDLQKFLPPTTNLQRSPRLYTLVTSRHRDLFGPQGLQNEQILLLGRLTEPESIQFILKKLKLDGALGSNQKVARVLGDLLGYLPLTLQQAVAYIREEIGQTKDSPTPLDTLQKYIETYHNEMSQLQDRDLFDLEPYNQTIYTTCRITLRKIKEREPLALAITQAISLLGDENIPAALILGIFKNRGHQGLQVNEGLELLEKYSMIQRHSASSDSNSNLNSTSAFFSIHRGNQHVIVENLKKEKGALPELLNDILEPCRTFIRNLSVSSPICKTILANFFTLCEKCDQILDRVNSDPKNEYPAFLVTFKETLAEKFDNAGIFSPAVNLMRQIVDHPSKFPGGPISGSENEVTPANWHLQEKLAFYLGRQGETTGALKLFRSVLAVQQSLFPPHNYIVHRTKLAIAVILEERGCDEQALNLYQEVFDHQKVTPGPEHPQTLNTKTSICSLLIKLGRHEEAKKFLTYPEPDAHQPSTSTSTVTSTKLLTVDLNNLDMLEKQASFLLKLGESSLALQVINQVLTFCAKNLGRDHPKTLKFKETQVNALLDLKNYAQALNICKELLGFKKSRCGENHPETLKMLQTVVLCQIQLLDQGHGDTEAIISTMREIWEKQKVNLGHRHPESIMAGRNLAGCLARGGRDQESLRIHAQMEIENSTNDTDFDSDGGVDILILVGTYLEQQGQMEQALKTTEKAYRVHQFRLGGRNDQRSAEILRKIGHMKFNYQEAREDAIEDVKEAVRIHTQVLGPGHPKTILSEKVSGEMVLIAKGGHQAQVPSPEGTMDNLVKNGAIILGPKKIQALDLERALELATASNKGQKPVDLNLGTLQRPEKSLENGEDEEALSFYENAAKAQERDLEKKYSDLIDTRHSMACCHSRLGNRAEALKISREDNNKMEAVFGRGHSLFRSTLGNLGVILEMVGEPLDSRIKCQRDLVEAELTALSEDHEDTLKSMETLADLLGNKEELPELEEALQIFQRLQEIRRQKNESDEGLEQKVEDVLTVINAIRLSCS